MRSIKTLENNIIALEGRSYPEAPDLDGSPEAQEWLALYGDEILREIEGEPVQSLSDLELEVIIWMGEEDPEGLAQTIKDQIQREEEEDLRKYHAMVRSQMGQVSEEPEEKEEEDPEEEDPNKIYYLANILTNQITEVEGREWAGSMYQGGGWRSPTVSELREYLKEQDKGTEERDRSDPFYGLDPYAEI